MRDVEVAVAEESLLAEVEAVEAGQPEPADSEPLGVSEALRAIAATLNGLPESHQLPPDARFALIAHLDDDARGAIGADSASLAGEPGAGDAGVVELARDVFGALLDAYHGCLATLGQAEATGDATDPFEECHVRLVRAAAQRIKWERCAGGPAHRGLWPWVGASFRRAVTGPAGSASALGPTGSLATSVEREYLRAVAFHSAALERLSPTLAGAIEGLVEFALPLLRFQADSPHGAAYFLAPGLDAAPRRVVRAREPHEGAWFLSTRLAVDALIELSERVRLGNVPAGLEGIPGGADALGAGIQHLLRYWSDAAPVRRYRRHLLGGKLTAVRGIEDLRQLFAGESVSHLAEWEFRDASRGGIGAAVAAGAVEPLSVGELVGILPHDGEAWQLGIVRRAWNESESATRIGLEALSQKPVLASADDGLVRTEVFVCDPLSRGEAVRIAAPVNTLRAGVPVFVTTNGSILKLKPLDASMTGDGFELRVYQVL